MYEEIDTDEDGGRTVRFYNDSHLLVKLIDESRDGDRLTEIIYFHTADDLKGWVELKNNFFIRIYIISKVFDSKNLLIFNTDGQLIEESKYDE